MLQLCGLRGIFVFVLLMMSVTLAHCDSYVAALKHSKQDRLDVLQKSDSQSDQFQPSTGLTDSTAAATVTTNNNNSPVYELPTNVYGPSDNTPFNVPAATYGVPVPATSAYSTSVSDWVSSSTSYQPPPSGLPPKPVYGPPPPGAPNTIIYDHGRPVYVPAGGPTIHQVYYGHSGPPAAGWEGPRESFWLLDKLKFKLDFFTIGKILLKLIIFKKIVKFIALICLLLFLPKLQALSASGDSEKDVDALDESRQFSVKYDLNARINETTTFALTAMDAFARKYPDECAGPTDILCRLGKVMDAVDERYPYKMIVAMYLPKNDEIASNEIA